MLEQFQGRSFGAVATAVPATLSKVTKVSTGMAHTCIVDDGSVYCWGSNRYAQLGDGTYETRTTPKQVLVSGAPLTATAVSAGQVHTCALVAGGEARCWEDNDGGGLGDGTTTNRPSPVAVRTAGGAAQTGLKSLSTGGHHTCALTSTATVVCWGENGSGQLGDGTTTDRLTPVAVAGLTKVAGVTTGHAHSCAWLTHGSVKCWGRWKNYFDDAALSTSRSWCLGSRGSRAWRRVTC